MIRFYLAIVLLLISSSSFSEVLKDKFVFKLGTEVYTVKDTLEYYKRAHALHCVYSDSLMFEVFSKLFKQENEKMFVFEGEFSTEEKRYFNDFIMLGKIIVYIKSYNVEVNPSLKNYFKLQAKKKYCSHDVVFNSEGEFEKKFLELLKLEVFLRNRFLPTEVQRKSTQDEFDKAVVSVKSLLSSISDQISHEVYW